jgi:hypothetical protein
MKALVAVALVLTSAPVVAAFAADNQEQASDTPKQERQICRRVETSSETRVARRRLCMTAAQWRARSDSSTDDAAAEFSVIGRETLETPGRTTIPQ